MILAGLNRLCLDLYPPAYPDILGVTDHRVKAFLRWLTPVLEVIGKNRGGAKVVVRATYAGERMKKMIEGIVGEVIWQGLDDFK